ncbi:MAG: ThiF family adenylyltransferase [Tannerella sp.]|jgi:molybdopterin/thiamine biosynthesis adenylyltransferase|nr:ThiF family adenylyltransferase [Tannerella sp.]
MDRYSRNRIYVRKEEQGIIKNTNVFLAGAGIGSIIAECALRFGFECITIVDHGKISLNHLNRQNYTASDSGKHKAEALANRLLSINPRAKISYHNCFIDNKNVGSLIKDCDIAINALGYKSDISFVFDDTCKKYNVPVLHPYNFGWAGFLTVVKPDGLQLSQLSTDPRSFELRMVEYVSRYSGFWNIPNEWLDKLLMELKNEESILPLPQLSIASWIVAGFCTNVMFNLATGREIKVFPKFYLSSVLCDNN